MRARSMLLTTASTLGVLLTAAPATAQDVRADIRIRTGPVTGRVIVGGEPRRSGTRERVVVVTRDRDWRPTGRVVVGPRRESRRVTIVEDFRANVQRNHARHGNRHVVAWWDPRRDEYGFQRWRAGLRRVLLCEHGDKFYVLGDDHLDWYDRGRRASRY